MINYINVKIWESLKKEDELKNGCGCINDYFGYFIGFGEFCDDPLLYMAKYHGGSCFFLAYENAYYLNRFDKLEDCVRDYFDSLEEQFIDVLSVSHFNADDKARFYLRYYEGSFKPWLVNKFIDAIKEKYKEVV